VRVSIDGETLVAEEADTFPEEQTDDLTRGYDDVTSLYLANASFEQDDTYGDATGNVTLGSTTYNPCYVNTVEAADPKWPNILPVEGWTAANGLTGGSNYCRMYSMPYSQTQYCVSPSNVGNYAARCSRPVTDPLCGDRVLTVLCSWDKGQNAITQTANLPEGKYRLLLDARYECPNQTGNTGTTVTTSGGNTNTSLTGVSVGGVNLFRYPTEANSWQQLSYDFNLDANQDVTVSLGFQVSASVGAANNTLLYIDHVRLLRATDDTHTGITEREGNSPSISNHQSSIICDLQGRRISSLRPTANGQLKKGAYIVGGKKLLVK